MNGAIAFILLIVIGVLIAPFLLWHFFIYNALMIWINSFYPMTPAVQGAMYWVIPFFIWLLLAILGIVFKRKDR